jgi:hypothetical protein
MGYRKAASQGTLHGCLMAISYIGGVSGNNSPLVLPDHGEFDFILLVTQGDNTNQPETTPGFTLWYSYITTTSIPGRMRFEYKFSEGGSGLEIPPNTGTGNFNRVADIYRGVRNPNGVDITPNPDADLSGGGTNRITFGSNPIAISGSWIVAWASIVMNGAPADVSTPPASLTRRGNVANQQRLASYDTNGPVGSFPDTLGPVFSPNRNFRSVTTTLQPLEGAYLIQTLQDVVLAAESTLMEARTANLVQTLENVTLIAEATIPEVRTAELVQKLEFVRLQSQATITQEPVFVCTPVPAPVINGCVSVVNHAVYTSFRLYDVLLNALYPAIRESNPMTAYDTLDDWLERLRWQDCMGSCRMPGINGLLPTEIMGECGEYVVDLEYPDCLVTYLKHATVVALTRLQYGRTKNLCYVNDIIAPLGAVIFPTAGRYDECPHQMTIAPYTDTFQTWQKLGCDPVFNSTCSAFYTPTPSDPEGLPARIYPGLMAAECIVRSMFPQYGFHEFERLIAVPNTIPNCVTLEL